MIGFDSTFDTAFQCIKSWSLRTKLDEVTFVRDVYGKIVFWMGNHDTVPEEETQLLAGYLRERMGAYFSGRIYWKKPERRGEKERLKPIGEEIEEKRREWKNEDGIQYYLLERPIAKKAWIYGAEREESVWPYEEAIQPSGVKVITFYSFKGGMGRTTALAGAALALAGEGKDVMMVDMDIEAPGLATLFVPEERIGKGVLDYMIESTVDPGVQIGDYVLDVTDPALLREDDGRVYLVPAGKVDQHYLQKLARIDYQDHRENALRESLSRLLTALRAHYQVDYILVDARASFHDMGGVAAVQLPHGVVLFGNDTRQSWDGMAQVLHTIGESHDADFPVMIVDTMCLPPTSPEYAAAKSHFIQRAYTACADNYYDEGNPEPGIDAVDVPHAAEFIPFNSELQRGVELISDGSQEQNDRVAAYREQLTGEAYRTITRRIKSWFGEE